MKTETRHTPGPWKVSGSCRVKEAAGGTFYHVAHVVLADDSDPNPCVAEVGSRGRYCSRAREAHRPGPEQAANARLIAAAPDLLAACRLAVDALTRTRTPEEAAEWDGEMQALLACSATIARAEGREA